MYIGYYIITFIGLAPVVFQCVVGFIFILKNVIIFGPHGSIRERELRSQTNRNLDRNTHFLWRMRSKHDNNTCSSSLTPQVNSTSLLDILNTAHFNGVPADNIPSYSFFSSSSHLLCYPLPIPLRAPLSSPGRDTKGPVRQSNQELPWMAGAYISPIHPLDISRQNSSRRYD